MRGEDGIWDVGCGMWTRIYIEHSCRKIDVPPRKFHLAVMRPSHDLGWLIRIKQASLFYNLELGPLSCKLDEPVRSLGTFLLETAIYLNILNILNASHMVMKGLLSHMKFSKNSLDTGGFHFRDRISSTG